MIQQVQHVEYGNAQAMETAIKNLQTVGEKVAAVIIERFQGEAGVIIPSSRISESWREICDKYGVGNDRRRDPDRYGKNRNPVES
jgi:putrescine aminotransferase